MSACQRWEVLSLGQRLRRLHRRGGATEVTGHREVVVEKSQYYKGLLIYIYICIRYIVLDIINLAIHIN